MTPPEFFALLSDETRLRCLLLLQKGKELCVCEFTQILNMIQPKISRHLALLRQSGLVIDERRGQWVYYSINKDLPKWMEKILASAMLDLQSIEPYKADLKKIKPLRVKSMCE